MKTFYEIKLNELIETLTNKNLFHEFSQNHYGANIIGIKGKSGNCFYWFQVINDNIYFDHGYSCNTGNVKKDKQTRKIAYTTLENQFNN
jgi:hypothetical protein